MEIQDSCCISLMKFFICESSKLNKYQRMRNNYDRLFMELSELIDDRQVYESLDEHLKIRVDSLLGINGNQSPNQTIKQLSCNDTEALFDNQSSSPFEPSTNHAVLRESNSNNAKKKQTLNSSGRITAKKIEISAFDDDKKTDKNTKSNNKPIINRNRSKSTKDLVRYNMQTSKSKSKSKDKNSKGMIHTISKKALSKDKSLLQKSIQKISIIDRPGKQNKKYIEDKNESKLFKKPSKVSIISNNDSNVIVQPRLKTLNSNLHQSRQILKKLATMETEPSRTSLSSNKTQSIKQKRSIKIPQKQLNIIDAINKKQEMLSSQKRQLEFDIRDLQQMIQSQRCKLEATNINITRINAEIARKQGSERDCSQDIKISRKKSEHFISQSRQIQNRIVEVNKSRDSINVSIEEEKYLINMYLTVIEEIKSQLKIQQTQKIDLIKRLVVIKNTEKMSMEKYLSKEAASDQIYRGMTESMKKWI